MKSSTSASALTHAASLAPTRPAVDFRAIPNPLVEITIPVLNEERILAASVERIGEYMNEHLPYRYHITIADNGSSDRTASVAQTLGAKHSYVDYIRLEERGRGRALKKVWSKSTAHILTYMDVDLSTNLDTFLPLITPLIEGQAGVAIGTRLHKQSDTTRSFKRDFISRTYNKIIRFTSRTKFSDAQCGFKAIRKDVARRFLPHIKDNEWFFDTELLIKTERAGIGIHEQPVAWTEDTDSRVNIVKTALEDLKGLHRVNKELDRRSPLEKFALPAILVVAGALYLFGTLHNDMANSYYAAAVQAASQNWTAWLFGSLDAANYVSVDKPPLATMIMGLSARIFGFSSFSMLLPSVLAGVGSVWLLYSSVKRQFGFKSGVIAALVLALTPVAALMFGFNNPDAILTFMLTASGYSFLRSLEGKKPLLWLGLAALFSGLAFNTKMLQGLMVLPAMVLVYLIFAKPPLLTRFAHMLYAAAVTAVSTFWWSILVWLTPASSRPWVGSTTDNNIWTLIFGYNGFGRLFGTMSGGGGNPGSNIGGGAAAQTLGGGFQPTGGAGAAGGGGMSGPGGTGFGGSTGLLRMWNTDFGPNIGWLLLAALIGGGTLLWILRKTPRTNRGRAAVVFWLLWLLTHMVIFSITSGVIHPYYVIVMAPAIAALVGISLPFLWAAYARRKPYAFILPLIVATTGAIAALLLNYDGTYAWLGWVTILTGIVGGGALLLHLYVPTKGMRELGVVMGCIACFAAPVAYTLATINVAHTGSIPTSGPTATAMQGSNNESATADSALVSYLLDHQDGATWIVAVASANESAALQLSTGQPVMALGGFNGSDTPLTLDEFKQLVSAGKLKYYAVSSQGGTRGGGMSGDSSIVSWVEANGTVVDYGGSGVTLYELSVD